MDEKENSAGGDFFIFSLRMWNREAQKRLQCDKKQNKREMIRKK
jgi:hypothetical protein